MNVRYILILIFGLLFQAANAQLSNERCKWVKTLNQPFQLDSLTIVSGSIIATNSEISQNITNGTVTIKSTADSVLVCYKVFPYSFHQKHFNRDLSVYDSNAYFKDPVAAPGLLKKEELFATEGLYKNGSISRGISFGNNQDIFVNSALNLNMEGKLTENLFIRAAITDQNVPYQPEGNTQQLQDFDNVYLQIYNDNFSLTGGDVVFKNQPSNFLKYYKNVQGGLGEVKYDIEGSKAKTTVGISVAKGRFASVVIQAIEGLSGPYRIPGPNNEWFILILANSERIFLDGRQLDRGFDNDYVIDYNSSELTFTNKILITEFSRIRVDYEFSDQNYSRSIAVGTHNQTVGKLNFSVNAYSEKDNRNKPLLFDLANDDKLFLSSIGDSLDLAVASTVDSVGFSNDQILYRRLTIINDDGNNQLIYEHSNNPDSAHFRVTFSDVGQGMGDYVSVQSNANGRVYRWISPILGISQGRYAPEIVLPTPNKKQMVALAAEYAVNDYESVFAEMAFSDKDENLYSDLNDDDNIGYALKGGVKSNGRAIAFLPEYKLEAFVDFEVDEKSFNAIDRFRYIEYDRDWSYDPVNDARRFDDRIFNAGIGIKKNTDNQFFYSLSQRDRGEQVNGYQHKVKADYRLGKFQWRSHLFSMNNNQEIFESKWDRYGADLSYKNGYVVPGYSYNVDHNIVKQTVTDSVQSSALYFDEHTFYLQNGVSSKVDFDIRHSIREDKKPDNGEIEDYSKSNTSQLTLAKSFEKQTLSTIFIYRKLDNIRIDKTEETISSRIDWSGNFLDNHVRSELTYAIANSQELKREFVFIRVPPGEGTHTWRDINEDGVQDLGEFFEAINADERNYAKIFTPSNEFVTAFQNLFIYRISIDAPRSWRDATGLKKFIGKFSNNTSWTADTKTTDKDLETRLLAFAKNIDEETLLVERNSLRTTVFYNRTNPVYGLELTASDNEQKQLLTNGFESRNVREYSSNIRFNFSRLYSFNLKVRSATREVASDFLVDRNYLLDIYQLSPQVAWQPSNSFRLSLQYSITDKANNFIPEASESAHFDEIVAEIKVNRAIQSNFSAQLRWIKIDFNGEESSPVGYDLLDALRPGTNITWTVNWQQKITSGLQLNLSYNGRKSEGNDPIHIGRVQVSALF
jgi:hypothetical protein